MTAYPPPTVETLSERIKGLEKLLDERASWQKEAMAVSEKALEAYKESANHMRGMLSDAQSTYLTISDYSGRHQLLEQAITELSRRMLKLESEQTGRRAGTTDIAILIGLSLSVLGSLVGVIHVFWK